MYGDTIAQGQGSHLLTYAVTRIKTFFGFVFGKTTEEHHRKKQRVKNTGSRTLHRKSTVRKIDSVLIKIERFHISFSYKRLFGQTHPSSLTPISLGDSFLQPLIMYPPPHPTRTPWNS